MSAAELTAADCRDRRDAQRSLARDLADRGDRIGADSAERRADRWHRAWVKAQLRELKGAQALRTTRAA